MTKNPNQRSIALKKAGGTRALGALPREKRAVAFASLLSEDPRKEKSSSAAALFAFRSAVEKGDVFRARKLAGKFAIPEEECREAASGKVKELRAKAEGGVSSLATDFELLFKLDGHLAAEKRFRDAMSEELRRAKEKLRIDYAFADQLFRGIIKEQQDRGINANIEDAAAWLAVSFIQRRRVDGGLGIAKQYLMKDGKVDGPQKILLEDELKKSLPNCSEGYLRTLKSNADGSGLGQLLHDSVLGMASGLDFTDLRSVELVFRVSRAFGIKSVTEDLGKFLANAYMGRAEAQPGKFMEDYLSAARAAVFAGLDGMAEEALEKYLMQCASVCPEEPKAMERAMYVSLEFGEAERAREFGTQAALLYIKEGNLEKAEEMANESGNRELLGQVCSIKGLTAL
ncbi:hypothetical protein GF412_00465 [Candidatus Micrarchaeota archaeon]|nr:hypothetical protein [Candidatus Micrarchaeota archaeon]MBD3417448.1 hypothetical protein [Candidatus Micrarchaeota archaeon]